MFEGSAKKKAGSMGKLAKAEPIIRRFLPYAFLFLASFLPFICYFQLGANLPSGDDSLSHRLWAWDLSYGWSNGFFFVTPSHNLLGNLGLGVYLFYGPLSHFMVAFLHLVFPSLGINACWKIIVIAFTFLMGCWMYMLGERVCGNVPCALMIALALMFGPYRINCLLYRAAYAEALALSFYPLIFLGVHCLGHRDYSLHAFLSCILGVSCCLLCHPYTGLIGAIGGAVYLLCCPKGLIGLFRSKRNLLFTLLSVALLFCLISFYVFPMLHYTSSGLYNVSNDTLMWTYYEYVAASTGNTNQFSGFLRPYWIEVLMDEEYGLTNTYGESWLSWCLDYAYFAFFGGLSVFLIHFFSKKGLRVIGTVSGVIFSCFPLLFSRRAEMFLIVPLFSACLLLISVFSSGEFDPLQAKREVKETLSSPSFYWCLALLGFSFLLIYVGGIWKIMPSLFYKTQFAWRLWGMILFLIALLLSFLVKPIAKKRWAQGGLAIVMGLSFLSCMGIVDKRFCLQSGRSGASEPSISLAMSTRKQGVQNEYVPRVFADSSYVSEYPNSLYQEIRAELYTRSYISYQWGMEEYLTPAFLKGLGKMEITSLNSPEATFDLCVSTDTSLIQLPQFYYEGYRLYLEGDSSYYADGIDVDGLVSFEVKEGTYKAELKWVGLLSYRVGVRLFFLGLAGCAAMYFVPVGISLYKKAKAREGEKEAPSATVS